jgi:transcriptional regulator with XRE-family HTH domain
MAYGLQTDLVRFEVDEHGTRTRAILPLSMYTTMLEFWNSARRAQTEQIEASTKPGKFRTSLSAVTPSGQADLTDPPPPTFRHDQHWQNLLEKLPDAPPVQSPVTAPAAPATPPAALPKKNKQTFYPREFVGPVPHEVTERINHGVYFLKAWREYRGLTLADIAGLCGLTTKGVQYFDYGYLKPRRETLERFALVFDCTLEQLTVKPKSNTQAWLKIVETGAAPAKPLAEEFAPEETDYPDGVLHSMMAGKSPLTAWRLLRGWSVADLAAKYGTRTQKAVKDMEAEKHLSLKTRTKLALIFHCEPVQLLRPEGLVLDIEARRAETPSSRAITQAMMSTGR